MYKIKDGKADKSDLFWPAPHFGPQSVSWVVPPHILPRLVSWSLSSRAGLYLWWEK